MATYVLVHGAWHGGWCWRRVAPALRAKGHEVYTPTLTGLGERSHLLTPQVGLDTHVEDVINVFEYEDLREAVLVGHSYGGLVITGAVASLAHRVSHLVYLDAFVPADGDSLFSLIGGPRPEYLADWKLEPISTFGVTDPEDVAWLKAKMTPHPRKAMSDPVKVARPVESYPFRRTYVLAAGQPMRAFPATAERLRANPAWKVIDLPTGHDMMVTMADELTSILLEAAR